MVFPGSHSMGFCEIVWRFFSAGQGADRRVPRIRIDVFSESAYLMDTVEKMLDEYLVKRPGYQTILKGNLLALFTELWRLRKPQADELIGSSTWQRLLPAIHRLYKTAVSMPTVEELASMTGWSVNHFNKLFHRTTGQSPSQFGLRLRAQQAATLLITTDDSVETIAVRTGYANARCMRKAFLKCFGATPSEYHNRRNAFFPSSPMK